MARFVIISIVYLLLAIPVQGIMLITRDEEVSIGREVQEEIIIDYGGLSFDLAQTRRVQRIGASIAAVSPRRDVTYTYQLVNSNIINAFAAPGGPVIITRKLAGMMVSDDELAFVLGHETGHIAAQHARNILNRSLINQGVLSMLFGGSSAVIQTGVGLAYTVYDRGYGRNQEYQADAYGIKLMQQAGYNTQAAIKALAKLGMDRSTGLNKYLATHPDTPRRIDRISRIIGISATKQQELVNEANIEIKGNKLLPKYPITEYSRISQP